MYWNYLKNLNVTNNALMLAKISIENDLSTNINQQWTLFEDIIVKLLMVKDCRIWLTHNM